MNNYYIRKAETTDIDYIVELYNESKKYMIRNGNATQWPGDYPGKYEAEQGVSLGNLYVMEDNGEIVGTFVFALGDDPTYEVIRGGIWLNDRPYGTIHRIASRDNAHGIFDALLSYCKNICAHIRIDTHEDNKTMIHLVLTRGFQRCGIIVTDNGTDRIAFELF